MTQETFPVVLDHGMGLVTIEGFEVEGEMVCGIRHIEGFVNAPPKTWLKEMREAFGFICSEAKRLGFAEIRFCGRDWSAVFPELEPFDGLPNGRRMRL